MDFRTQPLGIDLGASKACVAALDVTGTSRVVAAPSGASAIPPLVSFNLDGNVLVGEAASARRLEDPTNTLSADIRSAGGTAAHTRAGQISVTDVAALVLDHLRRRANEALERDARRVVLPVRMGYGEAQHEALAAAAVAAELNADLTASPITVAHAYGLDGLADGTTAVVDFGAGSCECSLLHLVRGHPQIIAWSSDLNLGGNTLDGKLVRAMSTTFWNSAQLDLADDPVAMARLWVAAEWSRRRLTDRTEHELVLGNLTSTTAGEQRELRHLLRRDELLGHTEDLFDRALGIVDDAMRKASLQPSQVARVLLVGGVSRTPYLRDRLSRYFCNPLDTSLHPENAVAIGAAVFGTRLEPSPRTISPAAIDPRASERHSRPVRVGRVTTKKMFTAVMPVPEVEFSQAVDLSGPPTDPPMPAQPQLVEVLASPLKLSTVGGFCDELLPPDQPIPTERTRVFSTAKDNQTAVHIGVCQGPSRRFGENMNLGVIVLEQLAAGPRGSVQIAVTFAIDADGVFLASARDERTGREQGLRVQLESGRARRPSEPL